jgi:hypothetical protein
MRLVKESAARRDFDEAVARRADEIIRDHKHFKQLVQHKMAPASVPAPRTPDLDRLELARIAKLAEAREVKARADRIVQASRGATAKYITDQNAPTSREQYFGPRDTWVKDAREIEYRDGPGVG